MRPPSARCCRSASQASLQGALSHRRSTATCSDWSTDHVRRRWRFANGGPAGSVAAHNHQAMASPCWPAPSCCAVALLSGEAREFGAGAFVRSSGAFPSRKCTLGALRWYLHGAHKGHGQQLWQSLPQRSAETKLAHGPAPHPAGTLSWAHACAACHALTAALICSQVLPPCWLRAVQNERANPCGHARADQRAAPCWPGTLHTQVRSGAVLRTRLLGACWGVQRSLPPLPAQSPAPSR
jgi:hypothetical protein